MKNQEQTQPETVEHQDAVGLETKPELANPADAPTEDETDSLEPDGGVDGDDTEPGTGASIGYAGAGVLTR